MYCTRCDLDVFDLDVRRSTINHDSLGKDLHISQCRRPYNENCSCIIEAPAGHHIRLEFSVFQFTDKSWFNLMTRNELFVYDGNSIRNASLGILTGTKLPFTVQSSSHFMMIQLKGLWGYRSIFKSSYYYSTTKGKLFFYSCIYAIHVHYFLVEERYYPKLPIHLFNHQKNVFDQL